MKKKKILITGGTGLLGNGLLMTSPLNSKIYASYKNQFDNQNKISDLNFMRLNIEDKDELEKLFVKIKPDVVIHSASLSNLDYCEVNKKEAFRVNVSGTENVIRECRKFNSLLVFISSNAVFNGLNPPYSEDDKVNPINYYGETKVLCENLIKKSNLDFVIIRPALIYGWSKRRTSPVTFVLERLRNNQKIRMSNDTYTNPVLNIQVAQSIWNALKLNKKGIFHIAGGDRVNRFEFSLQIAEVFNFDKNLIESIKSEILKESAKRMFDTTLSTKKMEKELLIKPLGIKEGLVWMKETKIKYE